MKLPTMVLQLMTLLTIVGDHLDEREHAFDLDQSSASESDSSEDYQDSEEDEDDVEEAGR